MKKRFSKVEISIHNIGKQRFWIGTTLGLVTAIVTSLVFNYFRELLRYLTSLQGDLLILSENEIQFYDIFFSSLATVLGLSIAVSIWMTNNYHRRKKHRIYKQFANATILWMFWLILMIVLRLGSSISLVLHGKSGYEDQLNLYDEFWLLFVLTPIFVFLQTWYLVSLIYNSTKWIGYSAIVSVLLTICLNNTTTIDQSKINNIYFKNFESDFNYIDQEVDNARLNYGITFQESTVNALKKWHSESSIKQVINLKSAFRKGHKVSLDSIILQKIVIRNFKENKLRYFKDTIANWRYAYPNDVLYQFRFHDSQSSEAKELMSLLKEQINLVNTPEIEAKEFEKYTPTEIRKSYGIKTYVPTRLIEQLQMVRDSLINYKKFDEISKDLPSLKLTHPKDNVSQQRI